MIVKTRMIPDGKQELKEAPILHYLDSKYLYFPVTNIRCHEGEVCVVEKQKVKVGEVIGTRKASFFEQPIHSTVSGEVVSFSKHYDSYGKLVDCVVVKNDFKYDFHESVVDRTDEEIEKLTKEDYIEIAKDAGLVGLGGGAFPTYIKLNTNEKIDVIVANGVECEPFLVSDYELMFNKPRSIIQGLVYAMKASGAKRAVIAIKKKYKEIKKRLDFALREFPNCNIEVKCVGNHYPSGWELETIKGAIGVTVPQGELTAKHGILVFNVSTLQSFYSAVKKRRPVLERFFTISGNGVHNKNFRVRIGTLVSDLVEIAGGYKDIEIPKVLVVGGPMMGTNVAHDDIIMTHTTTSLIVLNEEVYEEEPCIHCAACVYSCPVKIEPVQIMNAYKRGDVEALEDLQVNKCIECGLCSFVCPSKIPLTDYMKLSKQMLREAKTNANSN